MSEKNKKTVRIDLGATLPAILRERIEEHLNDDHGDKNIYLYNGPTHGCITHGIPITFSLEPGAIFFEAPREAVSW